MKTLTLGISGVPGSFSETAALLYTEKTNSNFNFKYLLSIENVLAEIKKGLIDLGIFPVVNFNGGLVRQAFAAMGKYNFEVIDEISLDVQHCLLVKSGTKINDITKIVSHVQALRQCQKYLKATFPKIKYVEAENTAIAARDLASGILESTCAVIASAKASEYGLEVIDQNIQDSKPNFTVFIIVRAQNL